MIQDENLRADLERIIDSSRFIRNEAAKDYYEDMGGFQAEPWTIIKPNSEEEVVAVVRFANERKIPLVARGAGTSLTGAVVSKNAIILDMTNFDKILKIDKVNWYVHVQAGVVLDDLNNELKKLGFFFPPDPGSSFACTVGGAIAEGSGGMRCVRYGTVKDWVLSVRLVLTTGKIVNLGEPLYKNRAGYDLLHLIVGSEGTLGIVTEAKLKIIPIPSFSIQRSLIYFSDTASVGRSIHALRESRIVPILFEFMDRQTIQAVNQDIENKFDEAEAVLLLDIEAQDVQRVEEILRANGAAKIQIARDEKEADRFYQARAMAYLSVKSSATGVHTEDVVVPIDKLAEYLDMLKAIAQKFDLRILVLGHAGDGNVHPNVLYDKSNESEVARAKMAVDEFCRAAIKVGGSVTGEHGVGIQKVELFREQLIEHGAKEALELMKGIKALFDKNSILNPGKYVEAA